MTIFRVGQRVRIVRAKFPENEGVETVIVALNAPAIKIGGGYYTGYQLDRVNRFGKPCVAHEHQLEPITDRPALAEWADCAWSPHRVGVGS